MGNYEYSYKRKATKMKNYLQRALLTAQGFPCSFLMVVSTHCSLEYSIWGVRNCDPRKILTVVLTHHGFEIGSGCRIFGQTYFWVSLYPKTKQRSSTVRSEPQPLVTQRFCRCLLKGAMVQLQWGFTALQAPALCFGEYNSLHCLLRGLQTRDETGQVRNRNK